MTTTFFQPVKLPGGSPPEWTGSESGTSMTMMAPGSSCGAAALERSSVHMRRRTETGARPLAMSRGRSESSGLRGIGSYTRGRSMSLPVDDVPSESTDELLIDIDTPVSKCMIYTTHVLERTNSATSDSSPTGDEEYAPRPTETWLDEVMNSRNPVQHRSTTTVDDARPVLHDRLSQLAGPKNLTSNRSRGLSVAGHDPGYVRHGNSPARNGDTSLRLTGKSTALLNFPRNTRRAVGATVGSSLGQTLANSTPEPSMTPSLSFDGSSMQKKLALDEPSQADGCRVSLFDFAKKHESKKPNPVAVALEKMCTKDATLNSPAKKDKASKKWWELSNKHQKQQAPLSMEKKLAAPDLSAVPKKSILVATPPTPTRLTTQTFDDNDEDDENHSIFSSLRNVDLVSSYIRESATKDAAMEEDIAKALDDAESDESTPTTTVESPVVESPAVKSPPLIPAAAPGLLRPPPKKAPTLRRAPRHRKRTAETALQRQLAEAKARIPLEFADMSGVVVKEHKRNTTRSVTWPSEESALEDIYVFEVVEPEPDDASSSSNDDEPHTLVDL
ncbi:hypothetical protein SPRG_22218 [Saprolegnia parasitica CBS 223.65]|uniref:Uncharacterized protein n=1 Tax=Saprolegnia parasitica (strain CBS 223.65) TaxID=695850 RepID=A0A067CB38_SAPPC|nr:hypothetical protein SPRG_22218 [Saprolegnia parasitica CBS 223.65]KDO26405.1 hypothetical protein SPRG_22218 [Saprolegnia parasitica CBS 223.65]|eukprot:XP_012202931.1 hypothetical protein SPRG_22218 [Saprolegnia parasitica CBS 223.65]